MLVKHPWDREVRGPDGLVRFLPLNRPAIAQGMPREQGKETYSVLYYSSAGRHDVAQVPFEVGLSSATDEELLALVAR